MMPRSRGPLTILVVALLALPAAARADDPAPAYPRTVHRHGQVCLEYVDASGTPMEKCRPEHGTWAQAGPPVPVVPMTEAARSAAAARVRTDRVHRRVGEWFLFATGLVLTSVGVGLIATAPHCGGISGAAAEISCSLDRGVAISGGTLVTGLGVIAGTAGATLLFVWDVTPKGLTVHLAGVPPPGPGTAPR